MTAHRLLKIGAGAALAGVWLALAWPAAAQPTAEQQNAIRQSCRSDFMSNCSGVKPGGAEALQCLQHNSAKLSPACRTAVSAITPPAPASKPAATAAAPTSPPAAAAPPRAAEPPAPAAPSAATPAAAPVPQPAPAPARTAAPAAPAAPARTAAPTAAPAAPAAAAVPAQPTPAQQNAIKQSCRSDFMSKCSGVTPGGAEALQCLQRNSAGLSPACRSAVAAIGGAPSTAAAPAAAAPAAAPAPAAAAIGQVPPRVEMMVARACALERRTVCDLPPGSGRVLTCLSANQDRITPRCKAALMEARAAAR